MWPGGANEQDWKVEEKNVNAFGGRQPWWGKWSGNDSWWESTRHTRGKLRCEGLYI